MRKTLISCFSAAVFAAAGLAAAPFTAQAHAYNDGDITVIATRVHDRRGGCSVVFRLHNRSFQYLQRARIWVEAADGNREYFTLSNRRRSNRELFNGTPCDALYDGLRINRARCNFRGVIGYRDCNHRIRFIIR